MSTNPMSPEERARLYGLAYDYASTWIWNPQQNRYVTHIDGLTTTDVAAAITHSQENSALAADYWVRAALALVGIAEDRLAQAHARDKTERTFDSLLDLSGAQDVVSSTAETLHQLTELARVARDRERLTTDNQAPDTTADPDPEGVQSMYDYLSHQSSRKPPAEVWQDAEYLVGCGYTVDDLTAFAHWADQANAAYHHHRATPGHQERHTLPGTDSDQVQRVYDYLSVRHPHHDGGELWNHAERLVGDGHTPDDLAQLDAYLTDTDTLAQQPEEIQATTSDQAHDTVAEPDPDEVQRVYDYLASKDPHQDRGKVWDHAEHLVGLGYTAQTLTEWNAQLDAYLADEAAYQKKREDAWGAHLAAQEHLGSYLDGLTPEQRNAEREIAEEWARANPEALGTVNEARYIPDRGTSTAGRPGPEPTGNLTSDERRVLAHIRGRTTMGKFAPGLYDWSSDRWDAAIDRLRSAGYPIRRVHGTVADDPSVTGGWVLDTSAHDTAHAAVTNSQEQGSQHTLVKSKDLPADQELSQPHGSSWATDDGTPDPAATDRGTSRLFSAETGSGAGTGGDGIGQARRAISHLSRSLNQREGPWRSEVPTILPTATDHRAPATAPATVHVQGQEIPPPEQSIHQADPAEGPRSDDSSAGVDDGGNALERARHAVSRLDAHRGSSHRLDGMEPPTADGPDLGW